MSTGTKSDFELASEAYDEGNTKLAYKLYEVGAQAGDASCQNNLGVLLESGRGCPKSMRDAILWYRKAYRTEPTGPAASNLATAYLKLGNERSARRWFNRAIAAGDGDAALDLAKYLLLDPKMAARRHELIRSLLITCLKLASTTPASKDEARELLHGL